jgi:hypothetical protein
MFQIWKYIWKTQKQKAQRIEDLKAHIAEVWKAIANDNSAEAYSIGEQQMEPEQNETDWLLQEKLRDAVHRFGLTIPDEYYDESALPFRRPTLSASGVEWATREVRRLRRENVKAWLDILAPTVSMVVALLSALVSILSLALNFYLFKARH